METGLTLSIWLVVTPNVLLLDYAGPAEALRMARDMGANFRLHTCSPQVSVPTTLDVGLSGLEPLPDTLPINSLVLIVGNGNEEVDHETAAAIEVVDWLRQVPRPDTRLASICSGALLLAKAGCLAGHRCTTHHSLLEARLGRPTTAGPPRRGRPGRRQPFIAAAKAAEPDVSACLTALH